MTLSRPIAALSLISLLAAPVLAQQAGPRIDTAISSDSKETMAEKTSFSQTTPKIFVFYMMADAVKGTRVKAAWIADKVDGYDPNNKFDESNATSPGGTYWGAFSYPRPGAAWPLGQYRVDLSVDGKVVKSVKFKIEKPDEPKKAS